MLTAWPRRLLYSRRGQGAVEYALILILVTVVLILALSSIGETFPNPLNEAAEGFGAGG